MGCFSIRIIQIGSLGALDLIALRGYMGQSSGTLQVLKTELSTWRHSTVLPPGGCTSALS